MRNMKCLKLMGIESNNILIKTNVMRRELLTRTHDRVHNEYAGNFIFLMSNEKRGCR